MQLRDPVCFGTYELTLIVNCLQSGL